MPLTSYITLGRSGLRVSPLCLGTMTFGEEWGWGSSVADSEAILAAYLDQGGNFIDTANVYTNGHSEKIIGDYFAGQKGRRDRVALATKFFGNLHAGDPNGGGAGRKAIVGQCEASLRRLQTDYIDLYWLHNWDRTAPIDETLRALDDLVAYTRGNRGKLHSDRTGSADGPTEAEFVIIDAVNEIAAELGANAAAVALAWVHSRPGVASTLIRARRLDQFRGQSRSSRSKSDQSAGRQAGGLIEAQP